MRSVVTLLAAICVTSVYAADLPPATPVPGGIAIVPLGNPAAPPRVYFNDRRVAVVRCEEETWCALVGLGLDIAPGQHVLMAEQDETKVEHTFEIQPKKYDEQRLTVKDSRYVDPSAAELKRFNEDKAAIQQAFATWTDTPPALRLALPVNGRLSGKFGLKRFFNGEERAPHSGIDLAVPEGTPVKAPAFGVVVETGDYFFNGKTVFIDHGQGLVTMYNHLRKILVKPGTTVSTGDTIGQVGHTGRVTGPHLHWGVSLNDSRIDPMLLLDPKTVDALTGRR